MHALDWLDCFCLVRTYKQTKGVVICIFDTFQDNGIIRPIAFRPLANSAGFKHSNRRSNSPDAHLKPNGIQEWPRDTGFRCQRQVNRSSYLFKASNLSPIASSKCNSNNPIKL